MGSLGEVLIPHESIFIRRGGWDTNTQKDDHVKTQGEEDSHLQAK